MSKLEISTTVAAAFKSARENSQDAADAMRRPFYLILAAYVPGYVLQVYWLQHLSESAPAPAHFGGMPAMVMAVTALTSIVVALAALAGSFNWQRTILKTLLGGGQGEAAPGAGLQDRDFRAYVGYSLLLALPMLAFEGLVFWQATREAMPMALMTTVPWVGPIMLLLLPLWLRFGLILPAVAAGQEPRSLKAAFALGAGNSWRMVAAMLLSGLLAMLLILLAYIVVMIPGAILMAVLGKAFGSFMLWIAGAATLVIQSIALVIMLTLSSGLMAFIYAQLHPGYDDPLAAYRSPAPAPDDPSAGTPAADGEAPASVPQSEPEDQAPAARTTGQSGTIAYGQRKRH